MTWLIPTMITVCLIGWAIRSQYWEFGMELQMIANYIVAAFGSVCAWLIWSLLCQAGVL